MLVRIDKPKYNLIREIMKMGYSSKDAKILANRYIMLAKSY